MKGLLRLTLMRCRVEANTAFASHLGTRAGCCRDGYEWKGRAGKQSTLADHLEIVGQLSFVAQKSRYGLPGVYHAAASESDREIAAEFPCPADAGLHRFDGGLADHLDWQGRQSPRIELIEERRRPRR